MGGFGPLDRRLDAAVEIRSVLLSAGRGKRLRPYTDVVAKPALPLLDVPLGGFGLTALIAAAAPVLVNVGWLGDSVITAFEGVTAAGWDVLREDQAGYGTAGTLATVADRIVDRVVVHNADLLTDLEIDDVLATHLGSDAAITLAVRRVDARADVMVDGPKVTRFVDRRYEPDVAGARYIGVAVIERSVIAAIPKTRPLGLGESVFAPAVDHGEVGVHVHDGYALDVGTVDDYLRAARALIAGFGPRPPHKWPGAIVDVRGGRAYVGPEASVEPPSLGPNAVVGRNARVAPTAEVVNAIVWPDAVVPDHTRVEHGVWTGTRGSSVLLEP